MNSSDNSKINLGVTISYIVSCILLGIYLIFMIFTIIENSLFGEIFLFFIALTPLVLFYLSYLVMLIFWIINFIKNDNKVVRKKLIIMLLTLSLVSIATQIIPYVIDNHIEKSNKIKMVNSVSEVANKIENVENNKYVYFLKDIQELDKNYKKSIYGKEYLSSSYITNYNDKIFVCLTDGTNIIKGNIDDLKLYKAGKLNSGCNYKFSAEEESIYLKNYLSNKYEFAIKDVSCEIENVLFSISTYCTAYTEKGDFSVSASVSDEIITVLDNYIEIVASENEKLIEDITNFTKQYLQVESLSNSDYFNITMQVLEEETVVIDTYKTKEEVLPYAESLANHLVNNENVINVKIIKFVDSKESDGEIIIGFTIKDNQIIWD